MKALSSILVLAPLIMGLGAMKSQSSEQAKGSLLQAPPESKNLGMVIASYHKCFLEHLWKDLKRTGCGKPKDDDISGCICEKGDKLTHDVGESSKKCLKKANVPSNLIQAFPLNRKGYGGGFDGGRKKRDDKSGHSKAHKRDEYKMDNFTMNRNENGGYGHRHYKRNDDFEKDDYKKDDYKKEDYKPKPYKGGKGGSKKDGYNHCSCKNDDKNRNDKRNDDFEKDDYKKKDYKPKPYGGGKGGSSKKDGYNHCSCNNSDDKNRDDKNRDDYGKDSYRKAGEKKPTYKPAYKPAYKRDGNGTQTSE
ncbi:hypothetical protein CP532_5903 [Ophiocordyceps camponoti-leonardi (nom. inval.)]|nr:hypothetical protein CP532_5903 [Ophiocordyceps camponoti-leonardi (nom. inval.)]